MQKITFIGAGNLATNLALELYEKKIEILQVYSRTEDSAKTLAEKVKSEFTTDLRKISAKADLYIISVKDDALHWVTENLNLGNKLVVHTAGSVPMSVFERNFENYGVFYPFQTFSKEKKVAFAEIPIFLEANSGENRKILKQLADKISTKVQFVNSDQRKITHVAGVFACNFTNHLFAIAEEILNKHNLGFNVLQALLSETLKKALTNSPKIVQTGPAVRNDEKVMNEHLAMLRENTTFAEIYSLLSKSIQHIK